MTALRTNTPKPHVPTKGAGAFVARSFEEAGFGIEYQLFVPEDYDPGRSYPLVLFLHGAGERTNDNPSPRGREATEGATVWTEPGIQREQPAFVLAPWVPLDHKWADADWTQGPYDADAIPISDQMRAVVRLLRGLVNTYNIDTRRLYVTGISMGGYGTWDALVRHPNLFAGAIAICGGGSPAHAARINHVPVRAFHAADDPAVPVAGTRVMVEALQAAGGNVAYTELAHGGHDIWGPVYADPAHRNWLLAQRNPCEAAIDPANH